ncbi:hypothetical protein ACM1RC_26665 [Paenibacillus azoreducens]|uniref:hypothetical protein n=1 Tax=Paenibacillus azoreducens TaxID=116718 RepID=UPI0039F5E6EE
MNKQTEYVSSGGIGVVGMLGIAFIVLKLTGAIDWSWWWVTVPFWGYSAITILVFVVMFTYYLIRDSKK